MNDLKRKILPILFLLFAFGSSSELQAQCLAQFTSWNVPGTSSVQFYDSSSGFGSPMIFLWDIDGTTYTNWDPLHTFPGPGAYSVCLTVTDSICTSTMCDSILVGGGGGGGCSATFTSSSSPLLGVSFAGTATGTAPFTYSWDFGDGSGGTGSSPTHMYGPGAYTACLTITDATGCTSTYCDSVAIGGGSSCTATYTYTTDTLGNATFAGSATGTAPFTYSWDFGDSTFGTGSTVTHSYPPGSSWWVCVTMTDATGCTDTYCDLITISGGGTGGGCTMSLSYSYDNCSTLTFTETPSFSPDYCIWDMGDGTTYTTVGGGITHTYLADGAYTVCVTGTDTTSGCTVTTCDSVSVSCGGTGGGCSATYTSSTAPSGSTSFTGVATGVAPFTYFWNFGDGTSSTMMNPAHTYTSGVWGPCLTITDATGCTSTYCDSLFVSGGGGGCSVSASTSMSGTSSIMTAFGTGTGPFTYTWDLGDSTFATGQTVTHTYAPGTYVACVTMTDASGCTSTDCITLTIAGPMPWNSLCGSVMTNSTPLLVMPADMATVFLIVYDSITNIIDTVATTTITPVDSGWYCFDSVAPGNYLVKAALDPASAVYSDFLPTYHGDDPFWNNAINIMMPTTVGTFYDINMVMGVNPGGPGFVSGSVYSQVLVKPMALVTQSQMWQLSLLTCQTTQYFIPTVLLMEPTALETLLMEPTKFGLK